MTPNFTLTERLLSVLRCFDAGDDRYGSLQTHARSLHGFGRLELALRPPFAELPHALATGVLDEYEVRLEALLDDVHGAPALPVVIVLFKPEVAFVERRHIVTKDGAATVRRALARMPPPTLLIDAAHEVAAGWRLTTPIADIAFARALLTRAAVLLVDAGEPHGARDVPIAGPVRSWNGTDPDQVQILVADPSRRYALAAIEAALRGEPKPENKEKKADVAEGNRRTGAQRAVRAGEVHGSR